MKFLVIRFSSIGDIVLASPVFRCLKKQVATAEVHLLTKYSFRAVTEANPYIDKFYYLDKAIDESSDFESLRKKIMALPQSEQRAQASIIFFVP